MWSTKNRTHAKRKLPKSLHLSRRKNHTQIAHKNCAVKLPKISPPLPAQKSHKKNQSTSPQLKKKWQNHLYARLTLQHGRQIWWRENHLSRSLRFPPQLSARCGEKNCCLRRRFRRRRDAMKTSAPSRLPHRRCGNVSAASTDDFARDSRRLRLSPSLHPSPSQVPPKILNSESPLSHLRLDRKAVRVCSIGTPTRGRDTRARRMQATSTAHRSTAPTRVSRYD